MDSNERGMNLVAMIIINPRKKYGLNQRFETGTSCSQVFYATYSATEALEKTRAVTKCDLIPPASTLTETSI